MQSSAVYMCLAQWAATSSAEQPLATALALAVHDHDLSALNDRRALRDCWEDIDAAAGKYAQRGSVAVALAAVAFVRVRNMHLLTIVQTARRFCCDWSTGDEDDDATVIAGASAYMQALAEGRVMTRCRVRAFFT